MSTITTYKIRRGNPIPLLCKSAQASTGIIIFTFGTETQEITSCESEKEVLTTPDMCLLGGDYFSANYKAQPGKVKGDLVFNSTEAKPVIRRGDYPGGGCSTGGTPGVVGIPGQITQDF